MPSIEKLYLIGEIRCPVDTVVSFGRTFPWLMRQDVFPVGLSHVPKRDMPDAGRCTAEIRAQDL
ncbi:hypothetical protein M513_13110 [Trichuris suis]|uniref:Uncharacterized protein n=1 Tax=Trichuris suis TaxID=68888 RepID=A0A085LM12_9BILA|nr:hypothetical protein M513_13110 [Trichuris suis]